MLRLFGPPALIVDGAERLFRPHRAHQLLAYLACRRQWVGRAELAELFWPDRPEGAARANLRVLLQRVLAEQAGIELQAENVRWPVDSDCARFERAATAGHEDEAIALYRPPLLEGLEPGMPEPLLEWLERERHRLDARWRTLVQARLAGAADGDPDAARLGQGLERAHPGALRAQRALAAAAARTDPAAFVGRRSEQADLARHLQEGARAVLILGPGGIGKTALLRAALPRLGTELGMPAVVVPLADLGDPLQAPARIALAGGAELVAGAGGWSRLARAIGARPLLLGMDNAEHLDGLDAALAGLLAACPGLRLVISSRRRLALDARTLPLEGLPQPDDEDSTEAGSWLRFDAVRLFDARARAATPGFDVQRDRAALLAVLRATEGLPLALELAAAATRFMPLADIAAELATSLASLDAAGAAAGVPARGLVACIERSWVALDVAAQGRLASLAWLPGPFTRAMAEAVAGVPLGELASLVDRSLLRSEPRGRLSLHPLIRRFVAERAPPPEPDALARAHATHVDHLLSTLDAPAISGNAAAMQLLADEAPHVRASWAWLASPSAARAYGDSAAHGTALMRLARVMGAYAVARGSTEELLPLLEHAVQSMNPAGRSGLAARASTRRAQAMLEFHRGQLDAATAHAREALAWAGRAGAANIAVACLTVLGNALRVSGRHAAARTHFEQAYRRSIARGDLSIAQAAANGLGIVELMLGRYREAERHLRECERLAEKVGDGAAQVSTRINLSYVERCERRWADARRSVESALARARALGLRTQFAILHTVAGEVAHELHEPEAARAHIAQALATLPDSSDLYVVPTEAQLVLAAVEREAGQWPAATAALAQALRAARESGSPGNACSVLLAGGVHLRACGEAGEAAALWRFVRDCAGAAALHRRRAAEELAALDPSDPSVAAAPPAAGHADNAHAALLDTLATRLPQLRPGAAA